MGKPPKELEQKWYQILEDEGFNDIENHNHKERYLEEWHSFKFPSEREIIRKERIQEYQIQIEKFLYSNDFIEICRLMVRHGNNSLLMDHIEKIWKMHCEGLTERQIAKEIQRSKTCIHKVLERLRTWMKLV